MSKGICVMVSLPRSKCVKLICAVIPVRTLFSVSSRNYLRTGDENIGTCFALSKLSAALLLSISASNMFFVDTFLQSRSRLAAFLTARPAQEIDLVPALIRNSAVSRCSTIYYCAASVNQITAQSASARERAKDDEDRRARVIISLRAVCSIKISRGNVE